MSEQNAQETQQEQDSVAGNDNQGAAAEANDNQAANGASNDNATNGAAQTTIAGGGEQAAQEPAQEEKPAAEEAEDWRVAAARHVAGDDEKAFKRELKRLERFTDVGGVYAMARELEAKFDRGGLVRIPGKKASEEEISEFQKALGWTDKPEELLEKVKLENGADLGDDDKPVLQDFVSAVNGAVSAEDFVNKAANWYFSNQEKEAAALDEFDTAQRQKAEQALKQEYGAALPRHINNTQSLYRLIPGGEETMSDWLSGRTASGQVLGNDPNFVRFLIAASKEINPAASVVEDGDMSGRSIENELAEIDKVRRENPPAYYKDEKMQARERELLDVQSKIRAKA